MARVLVTGVTGQIGSYLVEILLGGGHEVFGIGGPDGRPLPSGVKGAKGSLDEPASLVEDNGALDALVHLASRSSVAESWKEPLAAFDANGRLAASLVYATARTKTVRFVHASSAEIFGNAATPTQDESTPIRPISPYAVAKAAAHLSVCVARDGLGAPATNLVFYIGESPRRAPHFVFRKITRTVAAIAAGDADHLALGATDVVRDFTHARDLARACSMAALGLEPGDYVCATGVGHTVLDVARTACRLAGIDAERVLRTDPTLLRPNDIRSLIGDSRKIRAKGWAPSASFEALVEEVLVHDMAEHKKGTRSQ